MILRPREWEIPTFGIINSVSPCGVYVYSLPPRVRCTAPCDDVFLIRERTSSRVFSIHMYIMYVCGFSTSFLSMLTFAEAYDGRLVLAIDDVIDRR